jgi:hypothetical protein
MSSIAKHWLLHVCLLLASVGVCLALAATANITNDQRNLAV